MLEVPLVQFALGPLMFKIVNKAPVNLRKMVVSERMLENSVL